MPRSSTQRWSTSSPSIERAPSLSRACSRPAPRSAQDDAASTQAEELAQRGAVLLDAAPARRRVRAAVDEDEALGRGRVLVEQLAEARRHDRVAAAVDDEQR